MPFLFKVVNTIKSKSLAKSPIVHYYNPCLPKIWTLLYRNCNTCTKSDNQRSIGNQLHTHKIWQEFSLSTRSLCTDSDYISINNEYNTVAIKQMEIQNEGCCSSWFPCSESSIHNKMLLDVYSEHKMITSTLQTRIHFQLYQVNVIINRASLHVGETIIP